MPHIALLVTVHFIVENSPRMSGTVPAFGPMSWISSNIPKFGSNYTNGGVVQA